MCKRWFIDAGPLAGGFQQEACKVEEASKIRDPFETTGDKKERTIPLFREREGNAGCWEFKIMSKENNYFI